MAATIKVTGEMKDGTRRTLMFPVKKRTPRSLDTVIRTAADMWGPLVRGIEASWLPDFGWRYITAETSDTGDKYGVWAIDPGDDALLAAEAGKVGAVLVDDEWVVNGADNMLVLKGALARDGKFIEWNGGN